MGRRGPAPKPTALKVLQGNPGKRALPKNEPKPPPTAPRCPTWLSPLAKEEWRRVAPDLERLGLLTSIDGTALAGYCQNYATLREAQVVLDREGLTYLVMRGAAGSQIMARPEVVIVQRCWQLIRVFAAEFGLTPSARARITVPMADAKNEMTELLDYRK